MLEVILSIFVMASTVLFGAAAYYNCHHVFHRKWKVGDFAWYRAYRKAPWQLVQITDDTPSGFDNIVYVKVIHGAPSTIRGISADEYCVGKHCVHPIRWWQRNKADPIIMKHFLLGGM